jgi:hypothetical protein
MLKIRRELDLLEKPFGAEDRRELCVQDVYGNLAMMFEILREIDSRHATRTELTLDAVSAVQRRLESCYWLVRRWAGHWMADNVRQRSPVRGYGTRTSILMGSRFTDGARCPLSHPSAGPIRTVGTRCS